MRKRRIQGLCILLILVGVYVFVRMPVLALGFTDWSFLVFWGGVALLAWPLSALTERFPHLITRNAWEELLRRLLPWAFKQRPRVVEITNHRRLAMLMMRYKAMTFIGAALLILAFCNFFVFPILLSTPVLFSQQYRNLLGPVTESSFSSDVAPINLGQIRIVDEEIAARLADKKIGEIPALGSEVQLGQMSLQKVRDQLFYVAPLEYRGFFQWWSNRQKGSQGYVMVSATNPQDVHLVQQVNGEDIRLKYQTKGFFLEDLHRHLYLSGLVDVGIGDLSFEVDDDLHPYWVATLYRNKIGYGGSDVVGVAVVDAQSGEIQRYGPEEVPRWVDRVQPEDFLFHQIRDWGAYVNGFWNTLLAKTGTLRPAGDGLHLIYGDDDNVYWYTGISSSGKDESTVGFVLVNSRTKEVRWYKVAGANELSAKKSAEGQVQEKAYRAGSPVLYNIGGVPTYIMPMKDKEGLLKAVAFVSVENYNIVGVGADMESAYRLYRQNLAQTGLADIGSSEMKQSILRGPVSRISQVVQHGESYYFLMLEGQSPVFMGAASLSPKLPLVRPGDVVDISFTAGHGAAPAVMHQFKTDSY